MEGAGFRGQFPYERLERGSQLTKAALTLNSGFLSRTWLQPLNLGDPPFPWLPGPPAQALGSCPLQHYPLTARPGRQIWKQLDFLGRWTDMVHRPRIHAEGQPKEKPSPDEAAVRGPRNRDQRGVLFKVVGGSPVVGYCDNL